jgi:hypothetical protein
VSDTRLVENTPASNAWAQSNVADIRSKRASYYAEWMRKPEAERPGLAASDGM